MQTSKNYKVILFLTCFLFGSFATLEAAQQSSLEKQDIYQVFKQKKQQAKSFIKKIFSKKNDADSKIKSSAKITLILGITAAAIMLVAVISGSSVWLGLAYLISIPALIFSYRTFSKIAKSENREAHKKSKNQARLGMWLTFLTIAAPLIALVAFVIFYLR